MNTPSCENSLAVFAPISAALLTIASFLLTACSLGTGPVPQSADVALLNGTLIDGSGALPVKDAVLVVQGGRITAVGPKSSVQVPQSIRAIDIEGATILPGFINAHVHGAYSKERLIAWAYDGVTTVRDLGGPANFSFRDEVAEDPSCARLIAAGPIVSVPNGYPLVPWGSLHMLTVSSPDDAREKVGQLLTSGADIVKVAVESGASFQMTIPTLSPEELSAIVQTAHGRNTLVSAHILMSTDLNRAVHAGIDDAAHMVVDDLPDTLINFMVRNDIYWVPTIELWKNVGYGYGDMAIRNLRRFVAAGGKVALGTDYAGYAKPFQLGLPMHEIEWMQEAGMTPMQIIVAATSGGAYVCNRHRDLGTLEVGKLADVLVVYGDPLLDLHALQQVRLVLRGGVVIRPVQ